MYSYKLYDDGYDILNENDAVVLTQRKPYAKTFIPKGTYEDNAKAHINELNAPPEPYEPSLAEKNRADIDFMALMLDVDLPTEEEE
jgi:hypothetical protein